MIRLGSWGVALSLAGILACHAGDPAAAGTEPGSEPVTGSVSEPGAGLAPGVLSPLEGRASVLIFVMIDCPIANAYAPEIEAIRAEHAGESLDFYLVYVDPGLSRDEALEHGAEYGHGCEPLLDGEQDLASRLGITRTPEVAVVTAGGALSYRGRIDDRYKELARRRPAPTRRDLREHLEALTARNLAESLPGEPVPAEPVLTEAVGCLLPVL